MRQLSCILLFFITLPLYAANLSSYPSTSTPVVGEAFDLYISSNKPFNHEPNTQSLNKNFEVFGLSQSSQIKIINGKTQAEYQWIISLAAKKIGAITIPALYIGQDKTHAISLNVIKASQKANKNKDTIKLTSKISPKVIYPQQQVTYTVKLKISQSVASRLKNAHLSLPTAENAIIKPLGSDKRYQQQLNHTTYTIIERRYAIFPQYSGELTINGPIFQGEIETHHAGAFSFPFGFSGQEIKKTTPKITLTVQPAPKQNQGAWLPAKSIKLQGIWEQTSPKFQVGTPITRIVTIEATGLLSTQLPKIDLDLNKANIYPEQPVLEDFEKGNDIVSLRQETFAIIPIQPGKLTLPKVQIKWWNIKKRRFEIATLPEETIQVKPAPAATTIIPENNNTQTAKLTKSIPEEQQASSLLKATHSTFIKTITKQPIWPIISAILFILWLVTLYLYYRHRSFNALNSKQLDLANNQKTALASKKALKQACLNNNPALAKEELIKLAQELWSITTPNLLALQPIMSDHAFLMVSELNQSLYSNSTSDWQGERFWKVINPELKKALKEKKESNILPPLYPS